MTELGLANHQLAAKANASRQTIFKLRTGVTRMLPHWAKRLAPHLGVAWQEMIDGTPSPADQARVDLMAAYDAMTDEQRRALLIVAKGMVPAERPSEPVAESFPRRRAAACMVPEGRMRER
jgi:DNA-binding XRE family transcriptional regulator